MTVTDSTMKTAPGGTNVNINFPHLFRSFDRRSGLYPGSSPEARRTAEVCLRPS
ncbi:MAG: hypothetical protein MZV63_32390 [Marinilabiliales bacterium]|nr:hypothetical protein [Marinilabiliales bacterium]